MWSVCLKSGKEGKEENRQEEEVSVSVAWQLAAIFEKKEGCMAMTLYLYMKTSNGCLIL